MKKVIIIGGGIAGLTAGIYAKRCGFDVTVLESHSIPGGNCTAWKRSGYLFEGGMHWLTGSNPKEPLYKLWHYVGALNNDVPIHYKEPYAEYDHKGTPIRIYRDIDKTEKHWLDIAPEDAKEIRALCNHVRKIKNLVMPVFDLKGLKVTKKFKQPLPMLLSSLGALRHMRKINKIQREEYINRFSNEGMQDFIRAHSNDKTGIRFLLLTMGTLTRGSGGYPEGGSLPFVMRMAKTLKGLGGEILYNTRADHVVMENGKAVGVIVDNQQMDADAVIITADTMAIDHLFDAPPAAPWLDKMREVTQPIMTTFVSLGFDADLTKYPHRYIFKPETPIKLDKRTYGRLVINNYADNPAYSPAGKTAMTIMLSGDTYDFWKTAKENGTYAQEKQRIADDVIAAVVAQIPEAKDKIEVCDVATPLTYQRYCATWRGSWMTEMTDGAKIKPYPPVIEGLSGVYFAGHRMMPPGGFPVALRTGRTAVQYLCRDTNTIFVSED